MRRVALALMLALAAGVSAAPVWAQEGDEPRFTVHGEVRTRWEYVENYSDLTDTSGGLFDDSYDFFPFRIRIGAKGVFTDNVTGYAELQNVAVFGHQFTPQQAFQDPIEQTTQINIDTTEVHMYQGFLDMSKIGDTAFGLRLGRQEHVIGNQLIIGDLDFYGGQSFDGIRAWWDWENIDINAFYYRIGEENASFFGCGTGCGDDNLDFWGAYLTLGGLGAWGEVEPYVMYYADGDAPGNDKFYTIGARWTRPVNDEVNSDKLLDWNIEYAIQSGSNDPNGADEDLSGDIIEAWIGLNFGAERNHRVHVGTLMASGDDPGTGTEDEGWRELGYDTWDHNRLGDADFFSPTDIEDIFAGYTYYGETHGFRASYHMFTEAEPGAGDDDLGSELDVAYRYGFNQHLAIEAGVTMLEPGDAFLPAEDSVMRTWAQARLRW